MARAPKFYTKDYMLRAGMSFAIDVADPVDRIKEYMNAYKRDPVAEVLVPSQPMMTCDLGSRLLDRI
jgi:hypothetical protein